MGLGKRVSRFVAAMMVITSMTGCIIAAAGLGAEAGYVASQEDRTASETIGDQVIVTKIKAKLLADQQVSGMDINVDSHKGVVTLRGALVRDDEIATALEIARSTEGVKEVRSKLVLVGD